MPQRRNGQVTSSAMVWRGIITLSVAMAAAAMILAVVLFVQVSNTADQNRTLFNQQNDALCSFTDDLADRIHQSQDFLIHKPEVLKRFGFSRAEIKVQIQNQKATLDSLNGLDC